MQIQKPKKGYKLVKSLFGNYEEIPEEWNFITFSDIAKIKRGASPRPIDDPKYFGTGRGWIRISDVSNSYKYLVKTTDYLSELGESQSVPVNEGDLIMSIAATVGKPILLKMRACIHDGFVAFSNLSPTMDTEFLFYLLTGIENKLKSLGQHGTQSNLNADLVSRITFAKPQLSEQQKIASILSNIDSLIQQTQKIIEQTQDITKGLMHKLLTKGIGHNQFRKIPLIPRFIDFSIPESWNAKKLSEISIEIKDGPMGFNLHSYDYVESGIPILRIQNLKDFTVTKKDLKFITKKKHEELEKSQVKPYDIIISKTGVLGMIGIIPKDYGPANLNQALARIQLKDKSIVDYVTMFLASKTPQQILSVMGSGRTVQAGLKMSDIKDLIIPLPPKEERDKIISIMLSRSLLIRKQQEYKSKLEILKKSLMQKLLTGQIRVKV